MPCIIQASYITDNDSISDSEKIMLPIAIPLDREPYEELIIVSPRSKCCKCAIEPCFEKFIINLPKIVCTCVACGACAFIVIPLCNNCHFLFP